MQDTDGIELLTIKEASERFKVGRTTIETWWKAGKLAPRGTKQPPKSRVATAFDAEDIRVMVDDLRSGQRRKQSRVAASKNEPRGIDHTRIGMAATLTDAPCARDGCKKTINELARSEGDTYCSSLCCRMSYGVPTTVDYEEQLAKAELRAEKQRERLAA